MSLAKLMPIFVKYRLKLFAISKLSVTLDCSSKTWLGDVFGLWFDNISLILFHVFLESFLYTFNC